MPDLKIPDIILCFTCPLTGTRLLINLLLTNRYALRSVSFQILISNQTFHRLYIISHKEQILVLQLMKALQLLRHPDSIFIKSILLYHADTIHFVIEFQLKLTLSFLIEIRRVRGNKSRNSKPHVQIILKPFFLKTLIQLCQLMIPLTTGNFYG